MGHGRSEVPIAQPGEFRLGYAPVVRSFDGILIEGDEVGVHRRPHLVNGEAPGLLFIHQGGVVLPPGRQPVHVPGEKTLELGVLIGNGFEHQFVHVGQLIPLLVFLVVLGIALHHHPLTGNILGEHEGPRGGNGAHIRIQAPEGVEALGPFGLDDGPQHVHGRRRRIGHVEQPGVNLGHTDPEGAIVQGLPHREFAAHRQAVPTGGLHTLVVGNQVHRIRPVARGDGCAVGPFQARPEGEGDGFLILGDLPALGQGGLPLQIELASPHQGRSHAFGDVGGTGFLGQNGVEGFGIAEAGDHEATPGFPDFPAGVVVDLG